MLKSPIPGYTISDTAFLLYSKKGFRIYCTFIGYLIFYIVLLDSNAFLEGVGTGRLFCFDFSGHYKGRKFVFRSAKFIFRSLIVLHASGSTTTRHWDISKKTSTKKFWQNMMVGIFDSTGFPVVLLDLNVHFEMGFVYYHHVCVKFISYHCSPSVFYEMWQLSGLQNQHLTSRNLENSNQFFLRRIRGRLIFYEQIWAGHLKSPNSLHL